MTTDLATRLSDQPMRVETLYNFNGRPRIWGDGSEVKMIVDGAGLIDWAQTADVNPWLVKHCYVRGHNVDRELKRKFREQQCHDCGVLPGEIHEPGCDVATCPICGGQAISCRCIKEDAYFTEMQELGGPIPWGGVSSGAKEAIEYGFWCKWSLIVPTDANRCQTSGWVVCTADEMGSHPDLNRVARECEWDKTRRRWVKRQTEVLQSSETS
jgi:hypothetical protein